MIMPANYSVIAENELSYVDGGAFEFLVTPIEDGGHLLTTNIVTWIGNAYTSQVLDVFIGSWFKKDTSDKATGLSGMLKDGIHDLFQGQVQGDRIQDKIQYGVSNAIGVASAIWLLGTSTEVVKPTTAAALNIANAKTTGTSNGTT